MIFIDASRTPFGADGYGVYRHDMALSMSQQGKDNTLATQYANNAKDSLKKWKTRIVAGEFMVHTTDKPDGERATTLDALYGLLAEINKKKFVSCLEGSYNVIPTMYTPSSLKQGVECAFNEKTAGTFQSGNPTTKLETALDGAWRVPQYWISKPHLLISKIKVCVDGIINDGFQNGGGRVSIKKIYDVLKAAPYGFMPCNLSAFILGFVLKEYASGTYSWSDGLTNDVLNVNKLKEMIDEVIRLEITPNPRYKDKYIVALTPAEKAFNEITSVAFGIPLNMCTSVPNTRERIRSRMKEFSFPIWTLKYILEKETLQTETAVLSEIIDSFCGTANSNNLGAGTTDSDIAMAIGNLALTNGNAANDLQSILTKEKCTQGMAAYLETFENGTLVSLAQTVGDGGQYINVLRKKFDADAANWVWNVETAQQKIREVIDELTDFIHTYLPNKEEWIRIKDRIINDNERVKILTKISVDISIKTGEITFLLPDFGLTNKETMIDVSVWDQYRGELVSGQEVWGVVELGYRPPDDTVKPKIPGKIRLTGFTNFCPYTIDLDYYKDVRNELTTSEWIDVLLGAIDYNAGGYESEEQKLSMLSNNAVVILAERERTT